MGLFDSIKSSLGNIVDETGTALNLPDFGISEAIAGGNTINSGRVGYTSPSQYAAPALGGSQSQASAPSVLGAATSNAVSTPSNAAANSLAALGPSSGANNSALLGQAQNAINTNYDMLYKQLDSQAGFVNNDRQNLQSQIDDLFKSQNSDIGTQYNRGLQDLATSKQQVDQRTNDSINTLTDSLRNLRTARQREIGALGAGDQSGNMMLDYALGREQQKQTGDILKQANDLYTQIDLKKVDLQRNRDDQVNQLGTWYKQNVNALNDSIDKQLEQIRQSRLTATRDQQSALDQAAQQLQINGASQINAYKQQAQQFLDAINSHFVDRTHQADQMLQQIRASLPQTQAFDASVNTGSGLFDGSTMTAPSIATGAVPAGGLTYAIGRKNDGSTP